MSIQQKYSHLFSATLLSTALVACGGGSGGDSTKDTTTPNSTETNGSTTNDTTEPNNDSSTLIGTKLTPAKKQVITEAVVQSADVFALIDTVQSTSSSLGVTGTKAVTDCIKGSGSIKIINKGTANFDKGDSIITTYNKCINAEGDELNGTTSFKKTTSGQDITITATYNHNVKEADSSTFSFKGVIAVTPSKIPAYNAFDVGSIKVLMNNFTIQYDETFTTYKRGNYNFALDGNKYTYSVDQEVASNLFKGTAKAKTDINGFTGTHGYITNGVGANAFQEFIIYNPNSGSMTLTYPGDNGTGLLTSNADAKTYILNVKGTTTTKDWDWTDLVDGETKTPANNQTTGTTTNTGSTAGQPTTGNQPK